MTPFTKTTGDFMRVNTCRIRTDGVLCAVLICFVAAAPGYGAVTADPAQATFTSPQQSVVISLTADGAPIPAGEIRAWQLLASGHDYKHMLDVEKMEGALKIAPSGTLEVGSYDLNIETARGAVMVRVFAPLSDLPDIIDKRAALTGESEGKIKEKLGLQTDLGRGESVISLAPVYYEGQTLELTMPAVAGCVYAWFMNGEVVAEGPGENSLAHTFTHPGEYVLTFIETRAAAGGTECTQRAVAHTRVVPVPPVPMEVSVNAEITFLPPPGYTKHAWSLDGQAVSAGTVLKHTFRGPGSHIVECMASSPETGPAQGFMRTRYNVTVSMK